MNNRIAIVLFNLGGPDSLRSVRPFLFNLFRDRAIIDLPAPLRQCVAMLIAWRRAKHAREIYAQMGGKSPLLENTQAQAQALQERLTRDRQEARVFVAMRYWRPFSSQTAKEVKAYQPSRVVLLPLYPQFSTSTTASSLADWKKSARSAGLQAPASAICCYPAQKHLVAAHVKRILDSYWKAADAGRPRVIFSAHGLPEKMVAAGDPYRWQVERTVAEIVKILAIEELDHVTAYQSKVGPLPWLEPSTKSEIARASKEGVPVVIVPVSFVSEHSETLVELDIECRKLAAGCPAYIRVPAPGVEELFIEGLAALCRQAMQSGDGIRPEGERCPASCGQCPCNGKGGA